MENVLLPEKKRSHARRPTTRKLPHLIVQSPEVFLNTPACALNDWHEINVIHFCLLFLACVPVVLNGVVFLLKASFAIRSMAEMLLSSYTTLSNAIVWLTVICFRFKCLFQALYALRIILIYCLSQLLCSLCKIHHCTLPNSEMFFLCIFFFFHYIMPIWYVQINSQK